MSLRVKEPSTSVILIRHGITDYPGDKIYDETAGPGLNAKGRDEALQAGRWIKGLGAAGLFVSPAVRTRETVAPVAEALDLEANVDPALIERSFGVWEGLTFGEIEERYPGGLKLWKTDPVSYAPEGGESILDVEKRVSEFCRRVLELYSGKTVVVVTHMGPIRVAVSAALAIPMKNYRHLCVPTGSATRLEYGETAVNLTYLGVSPGGNKP